MKSVSLVDYMDQLEPLEAAYFEMNSYVTLVARLGENGNLSEEQIELWMERLATKVKEYELAKSQFYKNVISKMPEDQEYSKWEIDFDGYIVYFS